MTKVVGDVMYPNGKYIKEGEEKTRWLKCGALFETEDGRLRLKMEAMPTVMEEGPWFAVFEPIDGGRSQRQQSKPKPQSDVPF